MDRITLLLPVIAPHTAFAVLLKTQPTQKSMGFFDRGVITDKWSSRILWLSAIGSAVGLYMVMVERQLQNRERMMAEALRAAESGTQDGK